MFNLNTKEEEEKEKISLTIFPIVFPDKCYSQQHLQVELSKLVEKKIEYFIFE